MRALTTYVTSQVEALESVVYWVFSMSMHSPNVWLVCTVQYRYIWIQFWANINFVLALYTIDRRHCCTNMKCKYIRGENCYLFNYFSKDLDTSLIKRWQVLGSAYRMGGVFQWTWSAYLDRKHDFPPATHGWGFPLENMVLSPLRIRRGVILYNAVKKKSTLWSYFP
jgi:hypothetical protein